MAQDSRARQVWVAWEMPVPGSNDANERGGLQIALGSLQYLGIKPEDLKVGTTTYQQSAGTYKRRLYPGGPELTCTRRALEVVRAMPGMVSTNKSGNVMYLEGSDGTRDTIRVTGNKRAFAAWLKSKTNMGLNLDTVVLKNGNGTTYAILHEGPTLPI